jgi:hypothetical protein
MPGLVGSGTLCILFVNDIRTAFITWLQHCASDLDASRYHLLRYLLDVPQSCQAVPRHACFPSF